MSSRQLRTQSNVLIFEYLNGIRMFEYTLSLQQTLTIVSSPQNKNNTSYEQGPENASILR